MVGFHPRGATLARLALGSQLLLLVGLSAPPALSAPIAESECVTLHRQAQIDRKSRALRSALENLRRCADSSCPKLIGSDCAEWLVETERALPSIVVVATGPDGSDVQGVRILIDGVPLVDQVGGAAIEVDPGQHRFRFELAGSAPIERAITIREGEQRRRIEVAFRVTRAAPTDTAPAGAAGRASPSAPERAGAGPWPYALGAIGIVGVGGFAYFGYRGLQTKSDLDEKNCRPACPQEEVDEGNRQFLIADISLGVGVVALGAATYLWLSEREPARPGLRVEATPERAFVSWRAHF